MKITEITEDVKLSLVPTDEMNRFDLSTMINLLDSVVEEMFDVTIDATNVRVKVEEYRVTYEEYKLVGEHATILEVAMQKTKFGLYIFSVVFEHPKGVSQSLFVIE